MTHHIVMWKFKPEVADADKPRLLADMASHLEALVGQVPGLVSLKFVAAPRGRLLGPSGPPGGGKHLCAALHLPACGAGLPGLNPPRPQTPRTENR